MRMLCRQILEITAERSLATRSFKSHAIPSFFVRRLLRNIFPHIYIRSYIRLSTLHLYILPLKR